MKLISTENTNTINSRTKLSLNLLRFKSDGKKLLIRSGLFSGQVFDGFLKIRNCRQQPKTIKELWHDDKGAATLEVVIIIAVLLAIALIFNKELRSFAQSLFARVFDDQNVLNQIGTIGS